MEKNHIKLNKLKADDVDSQQLISCVWINCEYSCILSTVIAHLKKCTEHKYFNLSNLNAWKQGVKVIVEDNEHNAWMDELSLALSVYSPVTM